MDPTISPFAIAQDINTISGPQLITVLLKTGLIGVLSVQVFMYCLAFPNDRVYLKSLVYGIFLIQLVQSTLIIKTGFWIFATNFGDVGILNRQETSWLNVPFLSSLSTFFVQGFYAHRISILSQSKMLAGAIVALSFIQLGGGIAVAAHGEQEEIYRVHEAPRIIWNVGSVLCDTIIAACMIYYLSRFDTAFKETKVLLKKIIRVTIETGSLTAALAIGSLVLVFLPPSTRYYCRVPMGIIGNVFANSMLHLLNSRMRISFEKSPSTMVSALRFGAKPVNDEGAATLPGRARRVGG